MLAKKQKGRGLASAVIDRVIDGELDHGKLGGPVTVVLSSNEVAQHILKSPVGTLRLPISLRMEGGG